MNAADLGVSMRTAPPEASPPTRPFVPRSGRTPGLWSTAVPTAAGAAMVAFGYALGQYQQPGGTALFWGGQAVMLAAVAWTVVSGAVGPRASGHLVLLYAAAQVFVRWTYSPDQFRFSDELQHMRALINLVDTGHLWLFNFSLPISTDYPGTEIAAAQWYQLVSPTLFGVGTALAGLCHLLLIGCLLILFREVSGSPRIAALGALIFTFNPNSRFFDLSFIYETVALPFLTLALLFMVRLARRSGVGAVNLLGWLAASSVVVVTHHVSAVANVVLAGVIGLLCLLPSGGRRAGWVMLGCSAGAAGLFAAWVAFVSPATFAYFSGSATDVVAGIQSFLRFGSRSGNPILANTPLVDRGLSMLGVLLTIALLPVAMWAVRRQETVVRAFVWASATYPGIIGVRVLIAGGAELAIRALTFISITSSLAIGYALWTILDGEGARVVALRRRLGRSTPVAATAVVMMLLASGIATGVPSYWERLPGAFKIAGLGSGIDRENLEAGLWARRHLAPGSRVYGNVTALTLMSTYANLDPLRNPERLFYSLELTPADVRSVATHQAQYLVVDLRMSEATPVTGRYFPEDVYEREHPTPLALSAMTKFDRIPGMNKIYDSGNVKIYDLRGSRYAP